MQYENFDLRVTNAKTIISKFQDPKKPPPVLQWGDADLELGLELVAGGLADSDVVQKLGRRLYEALFPAAIAENLKMSYKTAKSQGKGLRLCLCIEPSELSAVPWELMHDGDDFLGTKSYLSLVRDPELGEQRAQSLAVDAPLRILVVAPGNRDYARNLGISPDRTADLLQIEILSPATPSALQRRLASSEYHVLHFVGHSDAKDARNGQPALLFEDEKGSATRPIGAKDLGLILYEYDLGRKLRGKPSLRLVLISDLEREGGREAQPDRNHSVEVAAELLRSVPAVIAMQNSLPAAISHQFDAAVYEAVVAGESVDDAVFKGRTAIHSSVPAGDASKWWAPVLLLHADDNQLLRLQDVEEQTFNASSIEVYRKINNFQVETLDRPTRLVLDHLGIFAGVVSASLIAYWIISGQADIMLISGIAVALVAIWLLSALFRRKMPGTLNGLWRERILLPKRPGEKLSDHYLEFLSDYNRLLNNNRNLWITRVPMLLVAVLLAYFFKPVSSANPGALSILVLVVFLPFELMVGYVIGTLLWKMIATVTSTTRLSYWFDLDIRPNHPDGCGGLKPLGDLYFENAKIALVGGLYFAIWIAVMSLSSILVERHVLANYPDQAILIQRNDLLTCSSTPDGEIYVSNTCTCIWSQQDKVFGKVSQLALSCICKNTKSALPKLIAAAASLLEFYRWIDIYSGFLLLMAVIAVGTFVVPMLETRRIMRNKGEGFHLEAYRMAGEIADLERYVERHGATSSDTYGTIQEINNRLVWLQARYRQYANPPLWPTERRVNYRMLGSVAGMLLTYVLSDFVAPAILSYVQR